MCVWLIRVVSGVCVADQGGVRADQGGVRCVCG